MVERFLERTEFSSYEDFKANYKLNIPKQFNFAYDVVDEWARIDENKPALVWCDDEGHEERYTFKDLSLWSNRMANVLKDHGIGKGDTVMLILRQRPEVWVAFLALHKIGAVCIPATFQLTPKDIIYRCDAASIKMILFAEDDVIRGHIEAARDRCTTLQSIGVVGEHVPEGYFDVRAEVAAASNDWERVQDIKNSDRMLIYFTSGTTGMPKMVQHDFEYPLGHITTAKYWQRVEDGGLHLTYADSGWAKFSWGKIYGQWICGAVLVAYDDKKFNAQHLLETMQRLKLTTFCAPPTVYRFFIKEDLSKYDLSSIHHAGIAGEPLNPEVFYRFKEATGIEVTEGFGQTETSVLLANFEWFPIKPGSTGKPSPLYDIDIVDEAGNSCEDGVVGRIVIKHTDQKHPTGLFHGYYRNEDATNACWQNGVYDTGDMAWRDADGYFWFEGRSDDVIKCSGYRIGPFEVESALLTHPSVLECAITAAPDDIRGQVVKATVVLTKGYTPSEELKKELQDHVKRVTAPYKYPRIVDFVDELPKTLSGKIRRAHIRNQDKQED